jgi:hypothetical protein
MQKTNTRNPITLLWRMFRDAFSNLISRDIAMMNIGQQVMALLDQVNLTMQDAGDMPESSYAYPDANCHWLQDLYVADDGSLYCITNSNGHLYRWPVIVAPDNTVSLGQSIEVKPIFATAQKGTLQIRQRTDGRYAGFAILGSSALNKDNEIDSRALFDCFCERFVGGREYVNIYHIGGDTTRIGELTAIFREENLLVGHYLLDDNPVANAAGATLAADKTGEWGGSVEFLSDDEGTPVEIAHNVTANMYTRGTLQGFSIARAMHGAAWGTAHYMTQRTQDNMNEATAALVAPLFNHDPEALRVFGEWLDAGNMRLAGSITRTTTDTTGVQLTEEQLLAAATAVVQPVVQAAGDMPMSEPPPAAPPPDPAADPATNIVVDDKLLKALTESLVNSDVFQTLASEQQGLTERLGVLEQAISDLQNGAAAPADAAAAAMSTMQTAAASIEERLKAMESTVAGMSAFYERNKPAVVQTATYRPGNPTVQTSAAKPPVVVRQAVPQPALPLIQQTVPMRQLWKRPAKISS